MASANRAALAQKIPTTPSGAATAPTPRGRLIWASWLTVIRNPRAAPCRDGFVRETTQGPAAPLETARLYRQFGAGWTSRTLQNALAWMLTSDAVKAQVHHARTEYAKRRTHMATLPSERVIVESHDGLGLWVRVLNEQQALLALASHGVAAGGASGGAIRSHSHSIRLAIGRRLERPDEVADLYALASRAL